MFLGEKKPLLSGVEQQRAAYQYDQIGEKMSFVQFFIWTIINAKYGHNMP
jgi:hypothetical protein